MSLATGAKLLVIASCPHRLRDGVPRPLVKTLAPAADFRALYGSAKLVAKKDAKSRFLGRPRRPTTPCGENRAAWGPRSARLRTARNDNSKRLNGSAKA